MHHMGLWGVEWYMTPFETKYPYMWDDLQMNFMSDESLKNHLMINEKSLFTASHNLLLTRPQLV